MGTMDTGRIAEWQLEAAWKLDRSLDRLASSVTHREGIVARIRHEAVRVACGAYLAFLGVGGFWFAIFG